MSAAGCARVGRSLGDSGSGDYWCLEDRRGTGFEYAVAVLAGQLERVFAPSTRRGPPYAMCAPNRS